MDMLLFTAKQKKFIFTDIYELFKIHNKDLLITELSNQNHKKLYELSIILTTLYKEKKWFYSFETYQTLSTVIITYNEKKPYRKKILKNLTIEELRIHINSIGFSIPAYNQAFHILNEFNKDKK